MDAFFDSSDAVRSSQPLRYVQQVSFDVRKLPQWKGRLAEIDVAYETYGELNSARDNAVLICHALSGDSHVASHTADDDQGWWEIMVGPGKPIDTNLYYVICPNCLGGCRGTTGPGSVNPLTDKVYATDFPEISLGDIVESQRLLIDHLAIPKLLAVIGGSLGGLMTLEWSIRYPERLAGAVPLATGAHLTSQALAFDIVARNAITSDQNYRNGQYHEFNEIPSTGLAIARMLGHITYLSIESMRKKFDNNEQNVSRTLKETLQDTLFETKFSVGSYLAHQGRKFVERFDANSYLTLSMAMDKFDLGSTGDELAKAMCKSQCRWLIMSFSTDWLFPPFLSEELSAALLKSDKRVSYCNVKSECGHDAFLLQNDLQVYGEMVSNFLMYLQDEQRLEPGRKTGYGSGQTESLRLTLEQEFAQKPARTDYQQILELIPAGAKVLDLGCGKGGLLTRLRLRGHERVVGIEYDERYVSRAVARGLDVVQADLNKGLGYFFDKQFDIVVLSKTLQTVVDVEFVLDEMLRVGTRCIVSFPNLGYHKYRKQLSDEGKAPSVDFHTDRRWYNTKDVRFLTINDFEELCKIKCWQIHKRIAIDTNAQKSITDDPNNNADVAIMVLGN
ncbi:MAG: homoserine O-acetyltransferase [Planctomycetaceae bacterium]|jgi:homoserine O-acetyltransferase|nr:homoserine O-acetyltransferase [Planctomycetaceae bacterium]